MRLGYHVSVSGQASSAITRGVEAGCDCIQIWPSSPRQWKPHPATEEEAKAFREARRAAGIDPVIYHGIYLVNLAAPDGGIYSRSIASLVASLEKADAMGVDAVVAHTGNPQEKSEAWALARIAEAVNQVLSATKNAMLLLETTAGSGSSIGHTFEQLGRIMDEAGRPGRLGLCLDTSHVFAAGYDIRTRAGLDAATDEIERFIGIERLKVLHLNDSLAALGSRIDRHAHIGEGEIGLKGFAEIVNHPALEKLPGLCELPYGEGLPNDLGLLRSLSRKG